MSNNHLIENRQIRVFISSTFRDMQDERHYLMKRTFPKLRKLAAERDVTLTELDLRWGITEEESKSGKVVEICLREIENSIPFFIGIIGNRYGWVPSKEDLGGNVTERFADVNKYIEQHLSVTEMEMQFGVLSREEDMHAYFYIKEQEEDLEKVDYPEMLNRLKQEVSKSKYPSYGYKSPEDLGKQVEDAFIKLLDTLFPEGNLSELEKERIGQRSFMNQLCQNYIKDKKNFEVLDKWLADENSRQFVVTGASGLGKSALIANWLKEKLIENNCEYNIIYHFTGNGGSESSSEHITRSIANEIKDIYGWEDDELGSDTKLEDLFIKVSSESGKPLLIVIDAINQIVDVDNAKLLNWLPVPTKGIKILFSTLEDDRTMEVFKHRYYPIFTLQPLDIECRSQLVRSYLKLYAKSLTDQQVRRIATDSQCENTLVLRTLLDELINFGIYEKLDGRIEYYLAAESIDDFYQTFLQSYEDEFGEEFVKYILSLIAVSRNGLSEDEILAITRFKRLQWSQFFCSFISHLIIKDGFYAFCHQYIREAVNKRYLGDANWERSCRMAVVGELGKDSHDRAYAELPYQYDAIGDYDSLYQQLLSLNVFLFQYKYYEYELACYWRKLKDLGFDYQVYRELLKKNSSEYDVFSVVNLFAYHLSLYKFALNLMEDLVKDAKANLCEDDSRYGILFNRIGNIVFMMGYYDKALDYHFKALKIFENAYGLQHSFTVSSYERIGLIQYYKGDYQMACRYSKKAMELSELILGKQHHETSSCYNTMGLICQSMGKYQTALDYCKKALEIDECLFGIMSTNTASVYCNIGSIYEDMGKYGMSLSCYQKSLRIRTTLLSDQHPDTALSYYDIGSYYRIIADYPKALKYEQKALDIRISTLGLKHPRTAQSYGIIGVLFSVMGSYDKALEYYQKALEINLEVLGKEHPDVALSYQGVGTVFIDLGEREKALDNLRIAEKIMLKATGKNHPSLASIYHGIGQIYHEDDCHLALKYHQKALKIHRKYLDRQHPKIAFDFNEIAVTYSLMWDFEKASRYYDKAIEILEGYQWKLHPLTATVYKNLARSQKRLGDVYFETNRCSKHYDVALKYAIKSLDIRKEMSGRYNRETSLLLDLITSIFYLKYDYNNAIKYSKKLIKSQVATHGKIHSDTANTYNEIGGIYKQMGDYHHALENLLKALEIREKVFGELHSDTANTYNEIGGIYKQMGDFCHALENLLKALEIREKIYGEIHSDTAKSYNEIGQLYKQMGKFSQALEYSLKTLEIRKKVFGEFDADTADTYSIIGSIYHDIGDNACTLQCYMKEMEIMKNLYDSYQIYTVPLYYKIGGVYKEMKNFGLALEYFQKALEIQQEALSPDHEDIKKSYDLIQELKDLMNKAKSTKETNNTIPNYEQQSPH